MRQRRRKVLTPDSIVISLTFNWFCLRCLRFACFLLFMGGDRERTRDQINIYSLAFINDLWTIKMCIVEDRC